MYMISGSCGCGLRMSMRFHERGRPCLWSLYGGTSNEWSSTITIVLVWTLQSMPWLLRASHHIGCGSTGLLGTPEMDAPNVYKGSRSQSSVHGLLCAHAQPRAHIILMCGTGFAHAEHRSTTRTCCASTSSRSSPFPVLIGGQPLFGGTQHPSTISLIYFQRICEQALPSLLLWAHDIGLNKTLLRYSIPRLSLCRKIW